MTDSFIRRRKALAEEYALYERVDELTDNTLPPEEPEEQPSESEEDEDFVVFDGKRYHKDSVVLRMEFPLGRSHFWKVTTLSKKLVFLWAWVLSTLA